MPMLNGWDITAHNNSVRLWYHYLLSNWEKLLQDGAEVTAGRLHLTESDRTVLASSLAGSTYIFRWPPDLQHFWAIICSSPHCHQHKFAKHPMRNGKHEALAHFKKHGLALTRKQMLLLFGYKGTMEDVLIQIWSANKALVINDLPGQLACGQGEGAK